MREQQILPVTRGWLGVLTCRRPPLRGGRGRRLPGVQVALAVQEPEGAGGREVGVVLGLGSWETERQKLSRDASLVFFQNIFFSFPKKKPFPPPPHTYLFPAERGRHPGGDRGGRGRRRDRPALQQLGQVPRLDRRGGVVGAQLLAQLRQLSQLLLLLFLIVCAGVGVGGGVGWGGDGGAPGCAKTLFWKSSSVNWKRYHIP